MKRRIVEYSPRAEQDLDWIFETVAGFGGAVASFAYAKRIRDFCDRLEYGAERGSRHDNVRPGLRILGFERRVTVAFSVEEDSVTILRLFYGGRDWTREFP